MNDDYVILIDENGQPYIAHGVVSRARDYYNANKNTKGTLANHLYTAKINMGNYIRYFYSPEELKAYYKSKHAPTEAERDYAGQQWAKAKYERKTVKDMIQKNAKDTLDTVRTSVGKKAENAKKWADDHDAGLSETVKYFTKKGKMSEEERDNLRNEMLGTRGGRAALKTAKAAKNAMEKFDEHDGGLTETMKYFGQKGKMTDEERNALRDEMLGTRFGKAALGVASAVKGKTDVLSANAKVKNLRNEVKEATSEFKRPGNSGEAQTGYDACIQGIDQILSYCKRQADKGIEPDEKVLTNLHSLLGKAESYSRQYYKGANR